MEVILREDVEKLGTRGQLVKVASGYARNFLLPKQAGGRGHRVEQEDRRAGTPGPSAPRSQGGGRSRGSGQDDGGRRGHHFAESRRERPALRFGDLQGHRRGAGEAGLHHRAPQDRVSMSPSRRWASSRFPVRLHREVTVEITVHVVKEEE